MHMKQGKLPLLVSMHREQRTKLVFTTGVKRYKSPCLPLHLSSSPFQSEPCALYWLALPTSSNLPLPWRMERPNGDHLQALLKVHKLPEIILVWATCFFQMFTLAKVKILTETWCKLPMLVCCQSCPAMAPLFWTWRGLGTLPATSLLPTFKTWW